MKELFKILRCPLCYNEITFEKGKLKCERCEISYKINHNIPNMIPISLEENIQQTVDIWNNLPYDYENHISHKYKSSPEYFEIRDKPLIDNLKGKVLEVGCGTARLAKSVEEQNCEYFGLDPALNLLKQGSIKGVDNLVCGVGEYLPFKKNSFDTIIGGHYSFRYINLEKGFREFERVLKPKGVLVFSLQNFWFLFIWLIINILKWRVKNYILLRNLLPFYKQFIHNDVLWISTVLNKLQSSGFETTSILTIKKLPLMNKFFNLEGYWEGEKWTLVGRDIIFICKKSSNY